MPQTTHSITVYCSSSTKVSPAYFVAAEELGRAIAANHWQLVYGGNCIGCMKSLADGARSAGGKVVGITPQLLVDEGIADRQCDELIVTQTMRQRKELMEQRGDAFVTLPGGLGTLEEIFEIIVGKYLAVHQKPILILNIDNFYAPLLEMIQHGIDQKFIKPRALELFQVSPDVNTGIEYLRRNLL
jgi:uncharacterized protein (TIGR00730 family)